jgi:5-methylcytosine-specific restriction endonuclease McrA
MTIEQFFKRKIFDKESIVKIRQDHRSILKSINQWYKSGEYKQIQEIKNKLESKIKQFAKNEEIQIDLTSEYLFSLYLWYTNTEKKCKYCRLSEQDLDSLHNQHNHINKRYPKRGKVLEIDRKNSTLSYLIIDNLVLACYWCNNAKTDTFTELEFLKIGKVINKIWSDRLNKKIK